MFINTPCLLLDDSSRADNWAVYFTFSNVSRELCPSLKHFFLVVLFIFITARCVYPAYPLHPPPAINNPARLRDSAALLVRCFQRGTSRTFKAQDTCASARALRCPRRTGNAAGSLVFLGQHPGFSACSYFTLLQCCCLEKPRRWISNSILCF